MVNVYNVLMMKPCKVTLSCVFHRKWFYWINILNFLLEVKNSKARYIKEECYVKLTRSWKCFFLSISLWEALFEKQIFVGLRMLCANWWWLSYTRSKWAQFALFTNHCKSAIEQNRNNHLITSENARVQVFANGSNHFESTPRCKHKNLSNDVPLCTYPKIEDR